MRPPRRSHAGHNNKESRVAIDRSRSRRDEEFDIVASTNGCLIERQKREDLLPRNNPLDNP